MTRTVRAYGDLARTNGDWVITAEPHVVIRLKRVFGRVRQHRTGVIAVKDTPEVARDLEWFLTRYPLRVSGGDAGYLAARAGHHRATEKAVTDILAGQQPLRTLAEPARKPRGYQLQAADIVLATRRLLLADDVGLGKTFSSLLVLRDPAALPALVVTLTHLPDQWLGELAKSLPWLRGHIVRRGSPARGEANALLAGGSLPDVLIMSYSKLAGWADHLTGRVSTVIFDEIQELRRGDASMRGQAAYRIADQAQYRMGLSATPVYNYGGEIHNIMQAIDPDALGTREEFLREWGSEAGYARHISVRDPAALGTYLRDQGLLLRRTRKDVHMELPEPVEIEQPVETDHAKIDRAAGDVAEMARMLLAEDTAREDRFRFAGEMDWRMRQATGVAKAPYVAAFARLLLESEQRIVLFGWHREVYDIWLDKLAAYHPVLYTGTESPAQKQAAAAAFVHQQSRVLIMSLRSGAGLDGLQEAASVAVFGELDWSPEIHRQCIGRLDRDGQDSTVVAYYMVSDDGTDPLIADVLGVKKQQAEPIRDPELPLFTRIAPQPDRARTLAAAVLARQPVRGEGGGRG